MFSCLEQACPIGRTPSSMARSLLKSSCLSTYWKSSLWWLARPVVTERYFWAQGHTVLLQHHWASCSLSKNCETLILLMLLGNVLTCSITWRSSGRPPWRSKCLSGYSSPSICRWSLGCVKMLMLKCHLQGLLIFPLSREGTQSLGFILCKPQCDWLETSVFLPH